MAMLELACKEENISGIIGLMVVERQRLSVWEPLSMGIIMGPSN